VGAAQATQDGQTVTWNLLPPSVTVSVPPGSGSVIPTNAAVMVRTDPLDPTKTALVVGGPGSGNIEFLPAASSGAVAAQVNGAVLGTFYPTVRLTAYGQGGDDDIQVAGGISLSAWLYGGSGNDRLKGGSGSNVLLGGAGDDLLVGGNDRDVLI